jgi:hypothetical protein
MTEASVQAEVTSEVSDEQVGEFFESKGEKAPEGEVKEEKQEAKVEEKQEQREKVVPYAALHQERMLRKEERARAEKLEARFQQVMERLTPKQEQVQLPDPQQDPAGFAYARTEQLAQAVQNQGETIQQFEQRQNAVRQQSEHDNAYRAACGQFATQTPDFNDAYGFVIAGRQKTLVEQFGMDPAEAQQRMARRSCLA